MYVLANNQSFEEYQVSSVVLLSVLGKAVFSTEGCSQCITSAGGG